MIDLVTTAPSWATSKNWCSSRPAAAQPDAVSTGLGSVSGAEPRRHVGHSASAPIASAPTRSARQRADVVPAHPAGRRTPGPRRRSGRSAIVPSSPRTGSTQVMHTPMPQAIDSSTATWARMARSRAIVADRLQHRHRPAGVDDLGADPLDRVGQYVGDQALARPADAVVGGDGDLPDGALGRQLAEQPPGGGRAEHDLDRRAVVEQRLREREQRRRAVAAADQHGRRRPGRERERGAERADEVERRRRPAARTSQRVPGPCSATTNWTVPANAPLGVAPLQRERAAQHHRGVLAAHADRDEVPGLEPARRCRGATTVNWKYSPTRCTEKISPPAPGTGLAHRRRARHVARASLACRSCSERTPTSPRTSSSMPCTAAAAACTVVRHGMPAATAAVRIS